MTAADPFQAEPPAAFSTTNHLRIQKHQTACSACIPGAGSLRILSVPALKLINNSSTLAHTVSVAPQHTRPMAHGSAPGALGAGQAHGASLTTGVEGQYLWVPSQYTMLVHAASPAGPNVFKHGKVSLPGLILSTHTPFLHSSSMSQQSLAWLPHDVPSSFFASKVGHAALLSRQYSGSSHTPTASPAAGRH